MRKRVIAFGEKVLGNIDLEREEGGSVALDRGGRQLVALHVDAVVLQMHGLGMSVEATNVSGLRLRR